MKVAREDILGTTTAKCPQKSTK